MKALLKSYNLLGDGLAATPAIAGFKRSYPEFKEVCIATHNDASAIIYSRLGEEFPLLQVAEVDERSYDFVFNFDVGKAYDLAVTTGVPATMAFAVMAGTRIDGLLPIYRIPEGHGVNGVPINPPPILLQPYSRCCSSHSGQPANKRWQDEKWLDLYERIREEFPDFPVLVLGGPTDPLIEGIPEEMHVLGRSFDDVALLQKKSLVIVTLDNGIAHLAASQVAHTVILYPACLPDSWMGDLANPRSRLIHARPWEVSVNFVWEVVREEIREEADGWYAARRQGGDKMCELR